MGEAQVRVGARLHGARHVDQEQNGAAAQPAHEARQAEDLAVVADRLLHGAAQVEPVAAPGRDAPVAAPLRQALGQRALEAAQRVALVGGAEAARRQGLGRRGGLAGLVDVVGGGRLEAAAAVLLHAQVVRVGLGRLAAQFDGAEEVGVEQRVELLVPLRRRRQGRMRGAADVVEAARAQQRDGGQERRGLLRRDGEAVGAQQRREGDERLRRHREGLHRVMPRPP